MKIKHATTEQIVGCLCLYKARCLKSYREHFRDREPGIAMLAEVTVGYSLVGELHRRLSDKDWEWYKRPPVEIGFGHSEDAT